MTASPIYGSPRLRTVNDFGDLEYKPVPIGTVCRPDPSYYLARIHYRGRQKYEIVSRHRSRQAAIKAMATAFAAAPTWKNTNRADVLMVEKEPSYYDPIQICELRR